MRVVQFSALVREGGGVFFPNQGVLCGEED